MASIILGYPSTASALLQIRDVDGQTPLHCSVRRQFAGITKVILELSSTLPSISQHTSLQGDLLYTEDSVGLTPSEITSLSVLTHRLTQFSWGQSPHNYAAEHLPSYSQVEVDPRRVDVPRAAVKLADSEGGKRVFGAVYLHRTRDDQSSESATEKGLEDVKRVVKGLEAEGGEKVKGRLDLGILKEWIVGMEKMVERAKERERKYEEEETRDVEETRARLEELKKQNSSWRLYSDVLPERPKNESAGLAETYAVLQATAASALSSPLHGGRRRHLVHLFDVQRSVSATLATASGQDGDATYSENYEHASRIGRQEMRSEHRRMAKHGAVGELEGEEEEEEEWRERRRSMVFQFVTMGADTL